MAELLGKRDVIVGPAGKRWETEPLISRAWGSLEGQPVACLPPPSQAISPPPAAPVPGGLWAGAWASPGAGTPDCGVPVTLPKHPLPRAAVLVQPQRDVSGCFGKRSVQGVLKFLLLQWDYLGWPMLL